MAGDWIKFEAGTPDKPEVWQIAEDLNIDPDAVVGKLLRVWAWFDQQTENGNAPIVSRLLLDRLVGVTGFCNSVIGAGWMQIDGDQLVLTNFDRHNGKTAKNRALTAKRVANHKAKTNAGINETVTMDALPKEEKRREDINPKPSCNQQADNGGEKRHQVPYQKIVDLYNKVCGHVLPQCLKANEGRRRNIRKCWNMVIEGKKPFQSAEFWEAYFNDCLQNPHWCGHNDRGWKADIEFVTRESSVLKTLEAQQ